MYTWGHWNYDKDVLSDTAEVTARFSLPYCPHMQKCYLFGLGNANLLVFIMRSHLFHAE